MEPDLDLTVPVYFVIEREGSPRKFVFGEERVEEEAQVWRDEGKGEVKITPIYAYGNTDFWKRFLTYSNDNWDGQKA